MIIVLFNKPEFEYDVHSLIKAFYPREEIAMYYTCPESMVEGQNVACTHHEQSGDMEELTRDASFVFRIDYADDATTVACTQKPCGDYIEVHLENDGERSQNKNQLKRALYDMLRTNTGKELPWGTLTGIRPTKIPMKLLEEGYSDQEIATYMHDTYAATPRKTSLAIEIAKRERELLQTIDYKNGYSLYVGIPFCPSTCAYCSFTSYPLGVWSKRVDDYLDALEKELEYTARRFEGRVLNSVYIGGGTPTTLLPHQLDRLIKKIKSLFDLSRCVEFTVEAGRPDSITEEKLAALLANGISRISVNPQTMKQATLDLIGRHHTVEQTVESFRLARRMGFDNINMDLIIGLPEENLADVRHTMEVLSELRPDNVTVHSLAVKRAARMTIYKDRFEDMQMVNTQEHMDLCEDYCRRMGLAPYYLYRQKGMAGNMENVGYAAEGKAGVYNILIMEEKQTIVACGAGATTKRVWTEPNADGTYRIERAENVKDVRTYMDKIDDMIARKRELFDKD